MEATNEGRPGFADPPSCKNYGSHWAAAGRQQMSPIRLQQKETKVGTNPFFRVPMLWTCLPSGDQPRLEALAPKGKEMLATTATLSLVYNLDSRPGYRPNTKSKGDDPTLGISSNSKAVNEEMSKTITLVPRLSDT